MAFRFRRFPRLFRRFRNRLGRRFMTVRRRSFSRRPMSRRGGFRL